MRHEILLAPEALEDLRRLEAVHGPQMSADTAATGSQNGG
jgi:hypothetical protein